MTRIPVQHWEGLKFLQRSDGSSESSYTHSSEEIYEIYFRHIPFLCFFFPISGKLRFEEGPPERKILLNMKRDDFPKEMVEMVRMMRWEEKRLFKFAASLAVDGRQKPNRNRTGFSKVMMGMGTKEVEAGDEGALIKGIDRPVVPRPAGIKQVEGTSAKRVSNLLDIATWTNWSGRTSTGNRPRRYGLGVSLGVISFWLLETAKNSPTSYLRRGYQYRSST